MKEEKPRTAMIPCKCCKTGKTANDTPCPCGCHIVVTGKRTRERYDPMWEYMKATID